MPLSLRFLLPLMLVVGLFAYAAVPLADTLMLRWFVRDLDTRSSLIASAVSEPLSGLVLTGSTSRIEQFFQRLTQDERLYAVGLCMAGRATPIASTEFPSDIACSSLRTHAGAAKAVVQTAHGMLHLAVSPVDDGSAQPAQLAILHDMSFVERRSEETRRYLYGFFAVLAFLVALITVVVAQLSWRGWVNGLRALLRGEGIVRPASSGIATPELRPIAGDVRELIRELEERYRPRDEGQLAWSAASVRAIVEREPGGGDVIVVSNREPYIHVRDENGIRVQHPASGLVTALEPVMRACAGTWIAHGSGNADRETVDRHDRVDVPPGESAYRLRRIWLTPEEEAGYYSGFANEGLWPLCHIAHVRPVFRSSDFARYREVNAKFADAIVEEARTDAPIVLVQDYHFALLPRMIRERMPNATVVAFWHIPWPNPEAFSICPWRAELLDGLLGSSILGFHTQFHCNNFVDTVDRVLEARVDRETFEVTCAGHTTAVRRYPISIAWPPEPLARQWGVGHARAAVRERLGIGADVRLGVGIDRLDYTKGILERFHAVDRLLATHPEWAGRFVFVQIAAPTRGMIADYRDYAARAKALADEINARYASTGVPPIRLIAEHHEADAVYEYYRAADVCVVTSLHDGMNLVAKEFVAARDDERGVLVLSQFAGASRELPEALVVNPYDADQCATALHRALTMPEDEQRDRMRLMRGLLREFNVYRWAGRMLMDAAAIRQRRKLGRRSREPARAS
ncbi:MAG: trehalose-6-phosphate synthase [Betaproteobacteria bacterium]